MEEQMRDMKRVALGAALLGAIVLSGCTTLGLVGGAAPPEVIKAVAVIRPTAGNTASGTVTFVREGRDVRVIAGLSPGRHGIHIHEFGDTTAPDGISAGGHFNPRNSIHGGPDDKERHMGDLGNLEADRNGSARYNRVDSVIRLNGPYSIIGRSVVIKAGADDFKTQPGGGARVAYGVIGTAALGAE